MHLTPRYRILYHDPWQQLSAPTPVAPDTAPISNSSILLTYRRPWYIREVKQPERLGCTIEGIDAITHYVYLMVTGRELTCAEPYAEELKAAISRQIENNLPPEDVSIICNSGGCSHIIAPGQPPSRTGLPGYH